MRFDKSRRCAALTLASGKHWMLRRATSSRCVARVLQVNWQSACHAESNGHNIPIPTRYQCDNVYDIIRGAIVYDTIRGVLRGAKMLMVHRLDPIRTRRALLGLPCCLLPLVKTQYCGVLRFSPTTMFVVACSGHGRVCRAANERQVQSGTSGSVSSGELFGAGVALCLALCKGLSWRQGRPRSAATARLLSAEHIADLPR